MNIKRKDKIYIGVSSVVVLAMAAAIGFLVAAKDGWDASIALVKWLQDKAGIPQTTAITALMGVLVVGVLAILILLCKSIWRKDNRSFTDPEEKRARELYLMWIRKDVDNRLKSSIHHATYIDLKLKESYELIKARNYTHHNNSDGTDSMIHSIDPLVDAKPFTFLLLGAPGAGKTTTLLNCVSQSVKEAQDNENNNIPVFINLSKWGRRDGFTRLLPASGGNKQSYEESIAASELDEWIIRVVSGIRRTGLTKDIVKYWLEEKQQVTLFLDGLDEADEAVRSTIVNKINTFVNKYSAVSVLITSRLADYEALVNTSKVKLDLDGAVTLHPLTPEQIKDYLKAANARELQDLFDHDEALKEMASSPLELSIMVLAWKDPGFRKLSSLKTNSITTKRIALFDVYVKAMIKREQLKRKRTPVSHESDLDKIEVSEEQVSAIYKNLGWIAKILCVSLKSTYSPGRLFDHLVEYKRGSFSEGKYNKYANAFSSDKLVKTVNKVIVFFALATVTLCYLKVYPVLLLFLAISFLLSKYIVDISRLDFFNRKWKINVWYVIIWPAIAIAVPFLYRPVGYFISGWPPLLWIFAGLAGIISLIFLYKFEDLDSYEILKILSYTPAWKHIVFLMVSFLPILFQIIKYNIWNEWFIIGVVAFLISIYNYVHESVKLWKILSYNLYAISAAVGGVLIFQTQTGLNTILCMQLLMILIMQGDIVAFDNYNGRNDFLYGPIAIFFGAFLGTFTGLLLSTGYMVLITVCLIVAMLFLGQLSFFEQLIERWFAGFGSKVLLVVLKFKKRIPFNYRKFLLYSCRALLLKKNNKEYEFIHRRIRDHFAIWEYMPLLQKNSVEGREYAIRTFSSLKDASCDVLLEMIDDNDKDIRTGCLIGLGEIGSALAVKSLIEATQKTNGELKELAIAQIAKVKDFAALPDLLNILNTSPIDSGIFNAALTALVENLKRLSAWDNDKKMSEYLNIPSPKYIGPITTILSNKQDARKKAELDWVIAECLTWKGSRLKYAYNLTNVICRLSNDELLACAQYDNITVARKAFKLLCRKGQVKTAVESLLQTEVWERRLSSDEKFSNADCRQMAPVFVNIIKVNDKRYLKNTLRFLQNYSVPDTEDAILLAAQYDDNDIKLESIKALKKNATKRSIPFLLQALLNNEQRAIASGILSSFKTFTLKVLLKKEGNIDIRDQLILILIRKAKFWKGAFLMKLLQQNNPDIQTEVIYKLGDFRIAKAVPTLLEMFNKRNDKTLEALIRTLSKLGERSIIPVLPELSLQYLRLFPTILTALIELSAVREIDELYEIYKKETVDRHGLYELQSLFAEHFAKTGKQEIAIEIMFPFNNNFINKWMGSKTSRKKIFRLLNLNEQLQDLLEIIYEYNAALAREIAIGIANDPTKDFTSVLINKILPATEPVYKMVLIRIVDRMRLKDYEIIKRLRSFLDEPQDDKITILAMKTLGRLKDDYSLNRFIFYLASPEEGIVKAALESIEILRESNSINIDNFPSLIKQSSHLQLLLTGHKYVSLLNMLNTPEFQKLAADENPDIRYLSAIYSGNLGHGTLIGLLNSLLDDGATINIVNDHGHTTVSAGALYALNQIGSPTAKSFVDSWQKKNVV